MSLTDRLSQCVDCTTEPSAEVQLARETLDSLMSRTHASLNSMFMERFDLGASSVGYTTLHGRLKTETIWLKKMSQRFDDGVYKGIREFICDFRLMLFNCYRFNGVDSRIGRLAEKLELLLEQKLQLMSPEIRAKTSIQSTLGSGTAEEELSQCGLGRRRSSSRLFPTSQLTPIRSIVEELEHALQPGGITESLLVGSTNGEGFNSSDDAGVLQQQPVSTSNHSLSTATSAEERVTILVARLNLWQRRRIEESMIVTWDNWWTTQNGPELQHVMDYTPQLLEIYQFLWLADPFLGLSDALMFNSRSTATSSAGLLAHDLMSDHNRSLCLYDLELGLSMAPQASQLLATCMTILLATPRERTQFISAMTTISAAQQQHCTNGSLDESSVGEVNIGYSSSRRSRGQQAISSIAPLDYDVWERRLAAKVATWYQSLWDKGKGSLLWIARRIGLSIHFFRCCGCRSSPLENQRFHELSLYQRIQIFHALCENTLRNFENLRLSMDKSADWEAARPKLLGRDPMNNSEYIHFPDLLNSKSTDGYRVYRIVTLIPGPVAIDRLESQNVSSPRLDLEEPTDIDMQFRPCSSPNASVERDENAPEPSNIVSRTARRGRTVGKRGRKTRSIKGGNESSNNANHVIDVCSGLSVPGSVRRLPSWLEPCLARYTQNRWTDISQKSDGETKPTGKSAGLSRSSSSSNVLSELDEQMEQSPRVGRRGRGRKTLRVGRGGRTNCARPSLSGIDQSEVEEMMQQEPALQPCPFATLSGFSRVYLSLRPGGRGSLSVSRLMSKTNLTNLDDTVDSIATEEFDDRTVAVATSASDGEDVPADPSCSPLTGPLLGRQGSHSSLDNGNSDDDNNDVGDVLSVNDSVNDVKEHTFASNLDNVKTEVQDTDEIIKKEDEEGLSLNIKYESEILLAVNGPQCETNCRNDSEDTDKEEQFLSTCQIRSNHDSADDSSSLIQKKSSEDTSSPLNVKQNAHSLQTLDDDIVVDEKVEHKECVREQTTHVEEEHDEIDQSGATVLNSQHCGSAASEHKADDEYGDSKVTEKSDEEIKEAESLITNPDPNIFALVARDPTSFQTLLSELRATYESIQSSPISSTSDVDDSSNRSIATDDDNMSDSSSSSNSSLSSLPSCASAHSSNSNSERYSKRRRRNSSTDKPVDATKRCDNPKRTAGTEVQSLSKLIRNVERLLQQLKDKQSEVNDAQKLARLRLRKDVERWNAMEEQKELLKQKQTLPPANTTITAAAESDLSANAEADYQANLAKERAERLMRRERLKEMELDEEDESDEADTDSDGQIDENKSGDVVPQNTDLHRINPARSLHSGLQQPTTVPSTVIVKTHPPLTTPYSSPVTSWRVFSPRPFRPPTIIRNGFVMANERMFVPRQRGLAYSPRSAFVHQTPQSRFSVGTSIPRFPLPRQSTVFLNGGVSRLSTTRPSILSKPIPRITSVPSTSFSNIMPTTIVTTVAASAPSVTAPTSNVAARSPTPTRPAFPQRRVYRVQDTLFTEDARPVKIGPNGALVPLPLNAIPDSHRQMALQMIARYNQQNQCNKNVANTASQPTAP